MKANIFIIGGVAIGCVRVVVYRVLEALFVCVDFGHVVCLIGLEFVLWVKERRAGL